MTLLNLHFRSRRCALYVHWIAFLSWEVESELSVHRRRRGRRIVYLLQLVMQIHSLALVNFSADFLSVETNRKRREGRQGTANKLVYFWEALAFVCWRKPRIGNCKSRGRFVVETISEWSDFEVRRLVYWIRRRGNERERERGRS